MLRIFDQDPPTDTLVQERLESLRRWSNVRDFVGIFLYLGLGASLLTYLLARLPILEDLAFALQGATSIINASAGIFALAFLGLTRVLGQLETDIWGFLSKEH